MTRTRRTGYGLIASPAAEGSSSAATAARLARQAKQSAAEARAARSEPRDPGVAAHTGEEAAGLGAPTEDVFAEMERRLGARLAARLRAEADRIREESETRLSEQIAALERAGADRAREAEALHARIKQVLAQADALAAQLTELTSTLGEGNGVAARRETGAPLEANKATLGDLRGLGLSLTQATRVLGHRDALGGFTSRQQLGEVPGISKALRGKLKRALTIRGARSREAA